MNIANFPPCPYGRTDCQLYDEGGWTTCIGWTPTYNREGERTNRDPNITSGSAGCRACGTVWSYCAKDGQPTTWTEAKRDG